MSEPNNGGLDREAGYTTPSQQSRWALEIKREEVQRTLSMREDLLRFLKWTFGLSLLVTAPSFLAVLFLVGWKEKTGFELSDTVIMFLGGVTMGEIAGLITAAITTFLGTSDGSNS